MIRKTPEQILALLGVNDPAALADVKDLQAKYPQLMSLLTVFHLIPGGCTELVMFSVAGTSFRKAEDLGLVGDAIARREPINWTLVPEPTNQYDPNAIKILATTPEAKDLQVGYVPAAIAKASINYTGHPVTCLRFWKCTGDKDFRKNAHHILLLAGFKPIPGRELGVKPENTIEMEPSRKLR